MIRIADVQHEFSDIPGVRKTLSGDVTDKTTVHEIVWCRYRTPSFEVRGAVSLLRYHHTAGSRDC
jgi:hypothetical protein